MSCAACSARVEKAVSKVDGVTSCAVSLLTNSMGVEGTADPSSIIEAVEKAGYGASLRVKNNAPQAAGSAVPDGEAKQNSSSGRSYAAEEDMLADHETPVLKKRLAASAAVLLVLMYFSMGHAMWDWPVPPFFVHNHIGIGLLEMLLALVVMTINRKFFTSGFRSLIHGAPNMDTLVALGSGVSFVYSLAVLFLMTGMQGADATERSMEALHNLYFESAAMIVTLITVGKLLESVSKGKTTNALRSLMRLAPKTATILTDDGEQEVPIEAVQTGTVFVVRPGEAVPVDGVVLEGISAVNESALTGESIPVDKQEGDVVSAATINQSGFLKCRATRVGEDTTLAQIIQMVSDAAATKAPIAKIADRVSGVFVPAVMAIAAAVFVIWMLVGAAPSFALARAIAVLVISCPCALGLATPVAIMVGNGVGAKNGILFKTSASLEETGRIQTVVLDKTGTITRGEPEVTEVIPADGISETQLLYLANLLEARSEHPLARAVTTYCEIHYTELQDTAGLPQIEQLTEFTALPGNGLQAMADGQKLVGGSGSFIREQYGIPDGLRLRAEELAGQGKTPLFFALDGRLLGIIAVADVVKDESPGAVRELRDLGIRVVMLTGDNERTAQAIGRQTGVSEVAAGVLPDGKEQVIRELKQAGKTAMVGDGINDAPALTAADIGIAIGAGTDVAIDAADVVLSKSRLTDVPAAIRLSRATLRNIHQNLFWAFFYNVICIPLAAGAWYHAFGILLSPMIGAAAMSLSSFCVVTNALRLNLVKIYGAEETKKKQGTSETDGTAVGKPDAREPEDQKTEGQKLDARDSEHQKPEDQKTDNQKPETTTKEEAEMTKTMNIKGMMCGHCEATVKKALEAVAGVQSAEVSHEKGTAIVTLAEEVSNDALKKAVEDRDYEVESIA